MAASLNRQYLQKIKKTIAEIESTNTDPLENYRKVLGQDDRQFVISLFQNYLNESVDPHTQTNEGNRIIW